MDRAAVERAGQCTDGGHHCGPEVGPGRRDDPRGERRSVEAVVEREDQVLLERAGVRCWRGRAVQHVQIVGGEAEAVARLDWLRAESESVESRR